MRYYTEYPTGLFDANSDAEALKYSKALVVYRESETIDGLPLVCLRESVVIALGGEAVEVLSVPKGNTT